VLTYAGVAVASKAFSATAPGRRLYRRLGNIALERMRVAGGLPERYVDRADRLLDICDRYAVLSPGDRVLEQGTGWVHWEATVVALHHDVRVCLYDVWDNRLLGAYKAYLEGYRRHLETAQGGPADGDRRARAIELAGRALAQDDFAGIYDVLGFDYVVEPAGDLAGFEPGTFALEVSADVLEHVPAAALPSYLDRSRQLLRPGGYAVHQIDLVDHYHYFDTAMSPKNYYRYDDRTWRRWFENEVQYFNRIQRPEWRSLFAGAGFETVEDDATTGPIDDVPLATPFDGLDPEDRACMQMLTVHRRPA
jgi:SAM-dependent methyltransferase